MSVVKNTDARAILDVFAKYDEDNRLVLLDLVNKVVKGEDTGLWPESEATRNEAMFDDEAAEMYRRASYIQTVVLTMQDSRPWHRLPAVRSYQSSREALYAAIAEAGARWAAENGGAR